MAGHDMHGERSIARGPLGWVAAAAHVAVGLFPYLASGLVAPPEGLVVLALIWIGLFVVVLRWRPSPRAWLLVVPVAAVALWYGVLTFGDAVLGWTA